MNILRSTSATAVVMLIASLGAGCDRKAATTSKNDRETNASATYVAPGEKDEYYLFYSG